MRPKSRWTGDWSTDVCYSDLLDAKVSAIAGMTEATNHFNTWTLAPPGTDNFHFLDGAIGSLMRAVDGGADAAPSPDARAGYATLNMRLDAVLENWNTLRTGEVSALNEIGRAHV